MHKVYHAFYTPIFSYPHPEMLGDFQNCLIDTNGAMRFNDRQSTNHAARYYRAIAEY